MTYKYTKTEMIGDDVKCIEEWVVDTFEELVKIFNDVNVKPQEEIDPKTLEEVWDDLLGRKREDDQKIKSSSTYHKYQPFKQDYWLGDTSEPTNWQERVDVSKDGPILESKNKLYQVNFNPFKITPVEES